jgi:hypothetical protein
MTAKRSAVVDTEAVYEGEWVMLAFASVQTHPSGPGARLISTGLNLLSSSFSDLWRRMMRK